jgi:hypothetical protein
VKRSIWKDLLLVCGIFPLGLIAAGIALYLTDEQFVGALAYWFTAMFFVCLGLAI